jgi:hypothetical protein
VPERYEHIDPTLFRHLRNITTDARSITSLLLVRHPRRHPPIANANVTCPTATPVLTKQIGSTGLTDAVKDASEGTG